MVRMGLTAVLQMVEALFHKRRPHGETKMLPYSVQMMVDFQADTFALTVRSRFHSMSVSTHHHPGKLHSSQTACECHPLYYALSKGQNTSADIPKK